MAFNESNDTILEVKDLCVNFYTNQRCNKALRNISFSMKRGKTLCIVGESGCGKECDCQFDHAVAARAFPHRIRFHHLPW